MSSAIVVPPTVKASVSNVPSTSTSVPISKLATTSVPVLGLYSKAPVSSNKPLDSLWNTIGKSVFALESVTVVVAAKVAFDTVTPAMTVFKAVPPTVIASAS